MRMWKKYCRAGQATDDNMTHAHCMLDTEGYKNTLRICNTLLFPLKQWLHEPLSELRYTYIACLVTELENVYCAVRAVSLTFRHRAPCILGQAFRYSPENAFYIFNQQIYFII